MNLSQQTHVNLSNDPVPESPPDHATMSELEGLFSGEFNEASGSGSALTDTKTLTEMSESENTAIETPQKLPVITTVIGAPVKRIASKRPREVLDDTDTEQGMFLKMGRVSFSKDDSKDNVGSG